MIVLKDMELLGFMDSILSKECGIDNMIDHFGKPKLEIKMALDKFIKDGKVARKGKHFVVTPHGSKWISIYKLVQSKTEAKLASV